MSLNKKIETKWYESDLYKWDVNSSATKFAIDTPPPTVSGSLHMGHVFSYTQADFIARFKRMTGHNVFYPIGFDDNGLPTEKLTEKIIGRRGKDMPKAEFITECKKVVFEAEIEFEKLFKALGLSFDWSQKYQTISDESIAVAHDSFNDLIQKGLIYKASNPVYWCTVDRTALSQADLEDKEKDSEEVIFKCNIDREEHKIMTTRPELIPACVMVLYHPDDARFKAGQMVKMPFLTDTVPLIADEAVKMDKGSGLVMCCSYGDWQDVEWIRKYKLKSKPIIQEDGFIDKAVYGLEPEKIKINEARKLAISLLDNAEIKAIKHTVKCAERSGAPIEIVQTEQYYIDFGLGGNGKVNAEQFKTDLLAIVDKIEFKPAHLKNRLTDWIKGLNQDWCISRDRFSGVPIPDSDQIFDTWFTSSVSPQLNTEAIKFGKNAKHNALFPFDLRPQAHEIIRTWAFYTIVKAYFHACEWDEGFVIKKRNRDIIDLNNTNQQDLVDAGVIPWKTVMLSGWCLAADKTKMSKSKGNIVTPMPLIEEKGADVVRYWASCSHLGVDTHYNETKFVDGKKLINKLKNVAKFIAPHKQKIDLTSITESTDKWAIAKLNETILQATKMFEEYNYCGAREVTEKFFWNIFCDNYLEIIKGRIYGEQGYAYKYDKFKNENIEKLQKSAATTTLVILSEILKLFAPIIPWTTEEIWSELFDEENSIHKIANFAKTIDIQTKTTELGDYMVDIIEKVRKYKAEKQLSIRAEIKQLSLPNLPKEIELDLLSVINAFEAEIIVDDFKILL